MEAKFVAKLVEDLDEIAKQLLIAIGSQKKIVFFGEMGVGKTTLIKAICKQLNVQDEVASPTFSIVNEYLTSDNKIIYHFDFFRIKDKIEDINIGFEDYLDSSNFCFIEWPNSIKNLLPNDINKIKMEYISETKRKIIID